MIDIDYRGLVQSGTDQATYTFAATGIGTPSADRVVVAAVMSRGLGTGRTVSSVTIGGVAAAIVQVENTRSSSNITAIAVASVPAAATADIVVVFSAGRLRCGVGVWAITGVHATVGDSDAATETADASVSVDAGSGSAVIAAICSSGTADSTTWAGITEDFDDTIEGFFTGSAASDSLTGVVSITADTDADTQGNAVVAIALPATAVAVAGHKPQSGVLPGL